jgi:Uma2 family endonuclease
LDELTAVAGVEVVVSEDPLTIRVPDVTVLPSAAYAQNLPRFRAADARLVVEVMSPGTRRIDRVLKASEYADAGVPQYWIVDLESPITLTAYLLVDGEYEVVAEGTGPMDLVVVGVSVRIDPASLTS